MPWTAKQQLWWKEKGEKIQYLSPHRFLEKSFDIAARILVKPGYGET